MRTTLLIADPNLLNRRTWMLLLLDAAERSGITPLPTAQIHQLAFYANGLTPVYEMELRGPELLRLQNGPFYPDVQWDIDRMAGLGLLDLASVAYTLRDEGAWLEAEYQLSEHGRAASKRATAGPRARRTLHFLMEIVDAYVRIGVTEVRTRAIWDDPTYGDPELVEQALIDLADPEHNATAWTAELFQSFTSSKIPLSSREKLHLYFKYLRRLSGGAAE